MKTLKHNFKTDFGVIDLAGLVGYTECLAAISEYIKENASPFGHSKSKYLNAELLINAIQNTAKELKELKKSESDEIQIELSNLTKTVNQ